MLNIAKIFDLIGYSLLSICGIIFLGVNVKTIFLRNKACGLLGLASLLVIGSTSSAFAQTSENVKNNQLIDSSDINSQTEAINPEIPVNNPVKTTDNIVNLETSVEPETQQLEFSKITQRPISEAAVIPLPGSTSTSSASLNVEQNVETSQQKPVEKTDKVAQADIGLGKTTRGGSSYIGIAGNIGLGGDSAVGDGNFMVISKVGLTRKISVRPAAVLGDNTVFLVPVTYDFSLLDTKDPFSEPLPIAPYVGAGAAIETGDDSEFSFLITGGIDVPLGSKFTGTAAINAAFFDDTDVGLMLGVGYNFSGL
ncbi:MAG: hypothetical protein AAF378_23915 [Cyanobacteria bacterium P01_A01_bin.84]